MRFCFFVFFISFLITCLGAKNRFVIEAAFAKNVPVREALLKRNWIENKKSWSPIFKLKWGWSKDDVLELDERKIYNHFHNFDQVGTKWGLHFNLEHSNKVLKDFQLNEFYPRAYYLCSKEESKEKMVDPKISCQNDLFVKDFERNKNESNMLTEQDLMPIYQDFQAFYTVDSQREIHPKQKIDGNKNIWILKPISGTRGVGIKVVETVEAAFNIVKQENSSFLVQKYIENPLLLLQRKFDIRIFVLVASLDPLVVFINSECYLRFSSVKYDNDNLSDLFIHLTNHQVQKMYKTEDGDKKDIEEGNLPKIEKNQLSIGSAKKYFHHFYGKPLNFWDEHIFPKLKQIAIKVGQSWPDRNKHQRKNSFEMLGFDIMLDDNFDPYLLEVNTNPGIHLLTDVVNVHHREAVDGVFKVFLDNDKSWREKLPEEISEDEQKNLFGNWRYIYKR